MTTPKIETLKANMTVLYTDNFTILYSYSTPVACYDIVNKIYYKTLQFHSITTSKHINQWLNGKFAVTNPQSFFDNLS